MMRKQPVTPEIAAEELVQSPAATDRVRLVGLDHAARLQRGRTGARERHLVLLEGRRPDDTAAIAAAETRLDRELQVGRSYGTAVQKGEISIPARNPESFILHGRVFNPDGVPADGLTVAAVGADGQIRRFTCTDGKGYFRMDIPKSDNDDRKTDAVFLQVSDADQAVLHRGDEAIKVESGSVAYREIRLSGERLPPCPIPPDGATMPNLLNRTEAEAVAILARFGLKVAQRLTQHAPNRAGLVVSHEPPAGTPIEAATEVTLVIGVTEKGDLVVVPDVVGKTQDEAEALLREAGLVPGQITRLPGQPVGSVLRQKPAAGTHVAPETAVQMVIAIESEDDRVDVPNLVGKALEDAEVILKKAELKLGEVQFRDDDRVGIVLEQEPVAGEQVEKESVVTVVVGRAREVERARVPDVVGRTLSGAKEILAAAKLKLGEIAGPENGTIAEQMPAARETVAVGTPVSVRLDRRRDGGEDGGSRFVDDLTRRVAADQGFATLGITARDMRTRLIAGDIINAEATQKLIGQDNATIQRAFGLRNANQARSFRRMLRDALARMG